MSRIQPPAQVRRPARALSIATVVFLAVGCTAPAVQQSQAPSAAQPTASIPSAQPTASIPSASPTASPTLAPTRSPSAGPTATSAASLAFEAPDGILPPWSFVVVVVDAVQLRAEPGFSAPVVGTASAGDIFPLHASEVGPVVVDGLDWYRLATMGEAVIWAAAGSGADRYLELVPPDCPDGDPDLAAVILMTQWEHLTCFGDRPLTFEGTYALCGCDGTTGGDFEPWWLANPMNVDLLWPDYQSRNGSIAMRFAPDSNLERPEEGSIVRMTGHFNDPVSSSCRMSTFDGEQATSVDPRTAELLCRERFVVDAYSVLGTDPAFP